MCFCERNGAFKGLSTLRVCEMCVCVWTQQVRTASLGCLEHPLPIIHTHISQKEDCLMRDFGQSEKKGEEERNVLDPERG